MSNRIITKTKVVTVEFIALIANFTTPQPSESTFTLIITIPISILLIIISPILIPSAIYVRLQADKKEMWDILKGDNK